MTYRPSEDWAIRTNVYVPLPVTNGVTLYSTHTLDAMLPLSSADVPAVGLLFHVSPVSVQEVSLAMAIGGPFGVPFDDQSRSVTCVIGWVTPLTTTLKYVWRLGLASVWSVVAEP